MDNLLNQLSSSSEAIPEIGVLPTPSRGKEKFAAILQKEITNSKTSESHAWILSAPISIPFPEVEDAEPALCQASVKLELSQDDVNSVRFAHRRSVFSPPYPPILGGKAQYGNKLRLTASKSYSLTKQKFPDLPLKAESANPNGRLRLTACSLHSSEAKGQQNQLYQQQMLLMPLLQFPMPKTTTDPNIMQSKAETLVNKAGTLVPTEYSVFIDANAIGNFIPENQITFKLFSPENNTLGAEKITNSDVNANLNSLEEIVTFFPMRENPPIMPNDISDFAFKVEQSEIPQIEEASNTNAVLELFRRQAEYIVPEVCKVVSQAFSESGISPEELHDFRLALFLRNPEKSIVISGKTKSSVPFTAFEGRAFCAKTKSCVAFCIAGIDAEKTRQLFFSAAPILNNRLKQTLAYKSPDKIESSRSQSNDAKRTEPNSSGVNTRLLRSSQRRLNSLENDGLTFLIRPRFEGFPLAQQAEQNASVVQNEQPNLLSDVSPADVINQIGHEIQMDLKMGLGELRVQLKPEHLGFVTLKASMMEGVLSVDINTESVAVKNIIESHLHDLRQTLSQQGIEVGKFNVSAEGNMSGFGSQSGTFYSHAQDSRGDERNPQLLDETWEQESWLARQTVIDLWL